jgi:hypothetical protein
LFSGLSLWFKKKQKEDEISKKFKQKIEELNKTLLEAQQTYVKTLKSHQQQLTSPLTRNQFFESFIEILIPLLTHFISDILTNQTKLSLKEQSIQLKLLSIIISVCSKLVFRYCYSFIILFVFIVYFFCFIIYFVFIICFLFL